MTSGSKIVDRRSLFLLLTLAAITVGTGELYWSTPASNIPPAVYVCAGVVVAAVVSRILLVVRGGVGGFSPRHVVFCAILAFVGVVVPSLGWLFEDAMPLPGAGWTFFFLTPVVTALFAAAAALETLSSRRTAVLTLGTVGALAVTLPYTDVALDFDLAYLPATALPTIGIAFSAVLLARFRPHELSAAQVAAGVLFFAAVEIVLIALFGSRGRLWPPSATLVQSLTGPAIAAVVALGLLSAISWTAFVELVARSGAVYSSLSDFAVAAALTVVWLAFGFIDAQIWLLVPFALIIAALWLEHRGRLGRTPPGNG